MPKVFIRREILLRRCGDIFGRRRYPDLLDFCPARRYKFGMSMAGKVVVVTGASMGIGEAIVGRFLREGATVVLASRDLGRVEAARQRVGALDRGVLNRTWALPCDVTVRARTKARLAAPVDRLGRWTSG